MIPCQRGDYWILENYIPAEQSYKCDESVTYTTHGDFTFLHNLDELTRRWQVSRLYSLDTLPELVIVLQSYGCLTVLLN